MASQAYLEAGRQRGREEKEGRGRLGPARREALGPEAGAGRRPRVGPTFPGQEPQRGPSSHISGRLQEAASRESPPTRPSDTQISTHHGRVTGGPGARICYLPPPLWPQLVQLLPCPGTHPSITSPNLLAPTCPGRMQNCQ